RAVRLAEPVEIDGRLTEAIWQTAPAFEMPYEVRPGENTPAAVRTEGWVAYDERAIYFAFRAHDPDPASIRARFADRDRSWGDDMLGVELDTFDDQRRAFEFFVNPLGVQMDMILDDVAGTEDASWDAIWESAGRITAEGYEVEMAIPFAALRFPAGGAPQEWGFEATRIYPRDRRYQVSFAPRDRGRNCFLCGIGRLEGLEGLRPGHALEITPTVTGSRTDQRTPFPEGSWAAGEEEVEAGLTARWGVTPNLTALAALNPDFSQVEADVARLEVNTRFALFYPEKRPFFLEGADTFDSVTDLVHTRSLADPAWGVKLAGKQGANSLGLIVTRDERTNLLFPGRERSAFGSLEGENLSTILRYRRDLGGSSTLGAFYTGREGDGYHNRLFGADGLFRSGERHRFRFEAFGSGTRYPEAIARSFEQPEGELEGHLLRLKYAYSSREWNGSLEAVDLADDFRADLGFVPQVGVRMYDANLQRTYHGDGSGWYDQLWIGGAAEEVRTQDGELLVREVAGWFEVQGRWQSFAGVRPEWQREVVEGIAFDLFSLDLYGQINPASWLELDLSAEVGDAIDYQGVREGRQVELEPSATLRLGRHLQVGLSHAYQRFDLREGWLFDAHLSELRATWQYSLRSYLRWVRQYFDLSRDHARYAEVVSASEREWFNQLLFAYKLNPQTVVFLGYSDAALGDERIDLTRQSRTLFLKLGYAWQL
ncbi:MAG TPA: DUF5916 domain-containing protein, partial [Thermoanaerobaculia bacterium]|nr:DUF5916 domain-containing protein [Thermoanaerobaculia bacterium]